MLLTGFDSKFLNTLYVDKNLKHHGLIQVFSRTNRVLNATTPYGNILDFRQQQGAVDAAIALFSGEAAAEKAREIWLVDRAPVVIQKLETAVVQRLKTQLDQYTDLAEENRNTTEQVLPRDNLLGFRGAYVQLPEVPRNRFKQICDLARQIMEATRRDPERSVALRRPLEAKDAAIRACV